PREQVPDRGDSNCRGTQQRDTLLRLAILGTRFQDSGAAAAAIASVKRQSRNSSQSGRSTSPRPRGDRRLNRTRREIYQSRRSRVGTLGVAACGRGRRPAGGADAGGKLCFGSYIIVRESGICAGCTQKIWL